MKYFLIDKSVNPKVIGPCYPQCIGATNKKSDNVFYAFAHQKGNLLEIAPNLDGIVLHKKSKLTDLISCSLGPGNDIIISNKFYSLIKQFSLSKIQVFDCLLYKETVTSKYNWVHFIYDLEKKIDYEKTEFIHPDEQLNNLVKQIKSYGEFIKFYDEVDKFGLIKADRTVLNLDTQLDFFVVGRVNQKLYISNRLKTKIEKEFITGIEIIEANDIIINCN